MADDNKSSRQGDQISPVNQDEDLQSSPAPSPPVVAFSVAQALSTIRQRREREDQTRQEKEKQLEGQRREKAKEKRQRRRQNQKLRKSKLREEAAERASGDSREDGVPNKSGKVGNSNDGHDDQGGPHGAHNDHEPDAAPSHDDEINLNSLPSAHFECLPPASNAHPPNSNESDLIQRDQPVKRPVTSLIPRALLVKRTKR